MEKSRSDINILNISKEGFFDIWNSLDTTDNVKPRVMVITSGNSQPLTFGCKLLRNWDNGVHEMKYLLSFASIVDSGLISLVHKLHSSGLSDNIKHLRVNKNSNGLKFTHRLNVTDLTHNVLGIWFWEAFECLKEFRLYYIYYNHKKSFNDPFCNISNLSANKQINKD